MGLPLLIVRLILAAVLLVSGTAKLLDRDGTRQAVTAFGLPVRFAPLIASALPIVELVLALTLIPARLLPLSAGLATALFLAFTVVVTRSVLQGNHVACSCFGQLSAAPITRTTIARNALLTGLALAVWIHALASSAEPVGGPMQTAIVLGLGLAMIGGTVSTLARRPSKPGQPTETPSAVPGGQLPSLPIQPLGDAPPSLASLHHQVPLVIIVTDSHCPACTALLPEIARWQREYATWLRIAVVTSGDADAALARLQDHGLTNLYLQQETQANDALGLAGTPCAVLVQLSGQIQGPPACGPALIKTLVANLIPPPSDDGIMTVTPPSRIGQSVPLAKVTRLDGRQGFVGGPSPTGQLLLFWNPASDACQAMLDDLRQIESGWPAGAPEFVVVAGGTPDANRALNLRSLIVLDESFGLAHTVGATGVPSAVLVDKSGRIAVEPAIGGPAILEMCASLAHPALA